MACDGLTIIQMKEYYKFEIKLTIIAAFFLFAVLFILQIL